MRLKIQKTYSENEKHIEEIQKHADNNKNYFGFLPSSAYEELTHKGQIWTAVSIDDNLLVGYLIFGGTYPHLRIFQLFSHPKLRKHGIGKLLIDELIKYGEAHNYLAIHAKVAAELRANKFWEKQKFLIFKQELGGTSKSKNRRKINFRSYALNTPDLLTNSNQLDSSVITYPNRPLLSPPIYAIDLNPLFDITFQRENAPEAKLILGQGFGGLFKLCVTPEFKNELNRHSVKNGSDPILEIATSLPTLRECSEAELSPLCETLRIIVFKNRKINSSSAVNNKSDLIHLAYCCNNSIDGFITRDKALLNKSDELNKEFGISIISPEELSLSNDFYEKRSVQVSNENFSLEQLDSKKRNELHEFLTKVNLNNKLIEQLLKRSIGDTTVKEILLYKNELVIGFASWNKPTKLSKSMSLHLYIDESICGAIIGIDHLLESAIRETLPLILNRIDLYILENQALTKSIAIKKGFLLNQDKGLTKIAFNGFIKNDSWEKFKNDFCDKSGKQVPETMPSKMEIDSTGIPIKSNSTIYLKCLSLFEFETLISPGILLHKERECLLLPIKENYAVELLGNLTGQLSFIPSKATSFLSEKAYFRSTNRSGYFEKGGLIAFYVSGNKSIQEIVGTARISFSGLLTVDQVNINMHQQGVLSADELHGLTNSSGVLHAFTFDNFKALPKRISFKDAKNKGIISNANLTTVEKLPYLKLLELLEESYSI